MSRKQSRAEFLNANPKAKSWAALSQATQQQHESSAAAIRLKPNSFSGKTAIVLGSGVGGLTAAYELLSQQCGMQVTVLEAQGRTGGRCLSLRTGDSFTEDQDRSLNASSPGETQVVRFDRPLGDHQPYLNAGPGRIPSSHKHLLSYLQQFGVELQIYVMNSESNLVQMKDGPFGSKPLVYRRLNHNTRGWLAQMVYANAEQFLTNSTEQRGGCKGCSSPDDFEQRVDQLRDLMVSFGDLNGDGKYEVSAGEEGLENGKTRAGYTVLPGVDAGEVSEALSFESLLQSEFWKKTRFYQPADFLWQPSLFQPVGGMDQVQHAFAQQVAALGGTIRLNSPVKSVDWDETQKKFVISAHKIGTEECDIFTADYCFSNLAIPFLKDILSPRLQAPDLNEGLEPQFKQALQAVYKAQLEPCETANENGYVPLFLACTTKVGWQADRTLWQGRPMEVSYNHDLGHEVSRVPDSEVGIVPIFGGISWTDHPITQIWYPSNDYHDKRGVLTGAYNFSNNAYTVGTQSVEQRLQAARDGAKLFSESFAQGLQNGVAIAWQNMPHIKGGWAQWHVVDDAVLHFNYLIQGSCIDGDELGSKFFIVGDQVSSLPGWQEGAITSALNAISRLADWSVMLPQVENLPDTRLMVEGI